MAIEELKKAHQMFDSRNLITELKWSRRNFNQIRGAISKNSKLYYTWIFDQCIKALEQESITDWIPVNNRLPEDKINPITKDFYEYQCTVKIGDFYDVRSYKFGRGHWWHGGGLMDRYVIAWTPPPEPYKDVDEVKKT